MSKEGKKQEPWPAIKKSLNHGNTVFVVDARLKGKGERRFFTTRKEAEGWQQQQRVRRANEGISGASITERLRIEAVACERRLQPFNASLTDAVDFFLKHSTPPGGNRTAGDLVSEFIEAKRAAGRREEYLRVQSSVLGLFSKVGSPGTELEFAL